MRQARTGLQESVQQLHLDAWKGQIVRVVEQGLVAGRVDVRNLVAKAVDTIVGGEWVGWWCLGLGLVWQYLSGQQYKVVGQQQKGQYWRQYWMRK